MGTITEAKERLLRHREDERVMEEKKQEQLIEQTRDKMLELWNAMNETHKDGIHLENHEVETALPDDLKRFLFNENGRSTTPLKMVLYTDQDGDIPRLIMGFVNEGYTFKSDYYLRAGIALEVREGLLYFEAYVGRQADTKVERLAAMITKQAEERSELLRCGVPMMQLAERKYLKIVDAEAGIDEGRGGSGVSTG